MSETRRLLLEYETELVSKLAKKDDRIRKELVRAFSDASEIVRERALLAAIELGDPTIVLDVVNAINDEEDDVRIAAAQVLAWYHQPRTIPTLLKGLKDSNPWVRSHCAAGLSKLMRGPIWARLDSTIIDKFVDGFPDTEEEEIREQLAQLNIRSEDIDKYIRWRNEGFDVEIDVKGFEAELEGPIILAGMENKIAKPVMATHGGLALSPEVEEILAELPSDIREKLPPEDLHRLTPKTARELVDSLLPPKKKKVKVRKVKRVRRVKREPTKEELLSKLPPEVRENVPEETLASLGVEELEALIASPPESIEVIEAPEKPKKKKRISKQKLIEKLPEAIRSSLTEEDIAKLTVKELEAMVETSTAIEKTTGEKVEKKVKRENLVKKYGEEKAEILLMLPTEILEEIPDDQIKEMDVETLKDLVKAFEPE